MGDRSFHFLESIIQELIFKNQTGKRLLQLQKRLLSVLIESYRQGCKDCYSNTR